MARTDAAIHPINGCFALLMMLAAIVGARRVGCARWAALLAAALVPTAPIVSFITTITYTDLAQGALVASSAVFAMPPRRAAGGGWDAPSAILCALSAAMALWVKFQMAPAIVAIALYRLGYLLLQSRARRRPMPTLSIPTQLAIGACALLLAAPPYIKTWIQYGSPVYPIELRIGPLVLFPGPLDPYLLGGAQSMPWLLRFVRFWNDWLAEITGESPGSFGPLLTILMTAPTLAICLAQLARPRGRASGPPGFVMLALLVLTVLVVPVYHWPRYSIWLLLPMSVCTAWVVQTIGDRAFARWVCVVAAALCAANAALFARHAIAKISTDVALAADEGIDLWTQHRNRLLIDALPRGNRLAPTPATKAALRAAMRPGETVVSAVHLEPLLLTDPDYTYRVDFRPAKPWPIAVDSFDPLADPSRGDSEAPAWIAGLQRDAISAAIVYANGAEDRALRAPGSGFEPVYAQVDRLRPAIIIYRRK